jgi:hypothetical protein
MTTAKVVETAMRAALPLRGLATALAAQRVPGVVAAIPARDPQARGYLVWDEGFVSKFAGSAAVLAALALGASRSTTVWLHSLELESRVSLALMSLAHRMELWSVLGLLSSSCCALQLLLNLFSFGCAGFNTILGPLRPFLMVRSSPRPHTHTHRPVVRRPP